LELISCLSLLLSISSAAISLYVYIENTHRKRLKYKIFSYIFEFFAPSYMIDKTPTTKMIYDKFKNIFVKEKEILSCLLELHDEKTIQLNYTLSSTFLEIHWMPNMQK